jgi:chaperonin GroEL
MNKTATQAVMAASQGVVHQKVVFGNEAHTKLLEGATVLAQAVGSTMGPSGHNVIIDGTVGAPLITKDGVTVAKSINLKERLPSMGAELLKEVASKTNELAGDGTTTATVLAHAMLKEGIKMVATGRDAIYVKKGMDFATEKVIEVLKKNCIPVRNSQDIINVGTISANGDVKVGELLSQAIDKVGQDGIITIEPGKSTQTTLEVAEGMQFDGGYLSPYFVTNTEKNTVELINPYILLTNRKISGLSDFIPILEKVANTNAPLLVIADDVEGEALHTLIVNKFKGTLASCAVKAPSYGENRTDILGDIAAVVGGTILDASNAQALKNLSLESLGIASKVVVSRTSTTIVGTQNEETKEAIQERVKGLRNALNSDGSLDELHIDRYKKRLAKLAAASLSVELVG